MVIWVLVFFWEVWGFEGFSLGRRNSLGLSSRCYRGDCRVFFN